MGIIPEGVTVKDIERELAILGQPKTRKGEKKEAKWNRLQYWRKQHGGRWGQSSRPQAPAPPAQQTTTATCSLKYANLWPQPLGVSTPSVPNSASGRKQIQTWMGGVEPAGLSPETKAMFMGLKSEALRYGTYGRFKELCKTAQGMECILRCAHNPHEAGAPSCRNYATCEAFIRAKGGKHTGWTPVAPCKRKPSGWSEKKCGDDSYLYTRYAEDNSSTPCCAKYGFTGGLRTSPGRTAPATAFFDNMNGYKNKMLYRMAKQQHLLARYNKKYQEAQQTTDPVLRQRLTTKANNAWSKAEGLKASLHKEFGTALAAAHANPESQKTVEMILGQQLQQIQQNTQLQQLTQLKDARSKMDDNEWMSHFEQYSSSMAAAQPFVEEQQQQISSGGFLSSFFGGIVSFIKSIVRMVGKAISAVWKFITTSITSLVKTIGAVTTRLYNDFMRIPVTGRYGIGFLATLFLFQALDAQGYGKYFGGGLCMVDRDIPGMTTLLGQWDACSYMKKYLYGFINPMSRNYSMLVAGVAAVSALASGGLSMASLGITGTAAKVGVGAYALSQGVGAGLKQQGNTPNAPWAPDSDPGWKSAGQAGVVIEKRATDLMTQITSAADYLKEEQEQEAPRLQSALEMQTADCDSQQRRNTAKSLHASRARAKVGECYTTPTSEYVKYKSPHGSLSTDPNVWTKRRVHGRPTFTGANALLKQSRQQRRIKQEGQGQGQGQGGLMVPLINAAAQLGTAGIQHYSNVQTAPYHMASNIANALAHR